MGGEDEAQPRKERPTGQGRPKAGPATHGAVQLQGRTGRNSRTESQSGFYFDYFLSFVSLCFNLTSTLIVSFLL